MTWRLSKDFSKVPKASAINTMPLATREHSDFTFTIGYTSFGRLKTLQVSNNGLTTGGSKLYHSKALVDSLAASSVRAKCTNHYFMLYQIKEKFILFICFVEPHRELIFIRLLIYIFIHLYGLGKSIDYHHKGVILSLTADRV